LAPASVPAPRGEAQSLGLLARLALGAAVAQPIPPTIEDQNDRRSPNPLVEEAWRSQEAVKLFRSGER
jgi:hypothetical protein